MAFNPITSAWEAKGYQLNARLTRIDVEMHRSNLALRPPLRLAVPYMEQTVDTILPVQRVSVSANDIRAMYDGLSSERGIETWLTWFFFKADAFIEHQQNGRSPDEVSHTNDVEKAAVIYAEAVNQLLMNTTWFGEPAYFKDRRLLLEKLAISPKIGNGRPLGRVQPYLERANHHFNRRVFNAIKAHPQSTYCDVIFPMAKDLYEELRSYGEQEYERRRHVAGFLRDQVLSLAVSCFRNLLVTDHSRQTFFSTPEIQDRAFGGAPARIVADRLIGWHEFELETYGVSAPGGSEPAECKAGRRNLSRAGELRCDLGFLQEIERLIVEARDIERIPE